MTCTNGMWDDGHIQKEFDDAMNQLCQALGVKRKKHKRKKSVDLDAIVQAVEDGRLEMWVDFDGAINIQNVRSGKCVCIEPTKDMNGEKY